MTHAIRLFLLFEVAAFVVAALIHRGRIVAGYGHPRAHIAESVIAGVLFGGLLLSLFMGAWTRKIGMIVQGFAIVGTLVGISTIIMGVGPRTVPDIVYHVGIVAVLSVGFMLARRAPEVVGGTGDGYS